jgi:multidrug efflux system membrane fusion protein
MPEQRTLHPPPAAPVPIAPVRIKRRGNRFWLWTINVCAVVLVAGLIVWRHRVATRAHAARPGATIPSTSITTVVARKGDIGVYVPALGAVTPIYTVMVRSRVDGELMKVNYVEGQMLQQGDSIAEIDPRPFQAQLRQAQGQLARDKALLENAHLDLARYQEALQKNAIPKQQLDTQVALVHQYEGAVTFDQGQVASAKLQLTYCHITSPITGRVGLRLVDPGNIVHATDTTPLAVVTQLQPITVIFSVAEDHLPEIQQQVLHGAKLTVDALDRAQQKKLASGVLLTLDNQVDPATGTVRLKAEFPNPDNALFPSQFVNARLLVTTEHDVVLVPSTAVQHGAQGTFVYEVRPDHTVAVRPVSTGTTDGNVTAVKDLEPGVLIAADNFNRLQDGAHVNPRAAEGQPGRTNSVASTTP